LTTILSILFLYLNTVTVTTGKLWKQTSFISVPFVRHHDIRLWSIYFSHHNILPWTMSVIPVFMQMMLKSSDRYWRLSVLIKLCAYATYTTLSESYVRFNKFFELLSYCGSLQVLSIHFSVYFSRCHASNNYVEHHIWFFEVWLTFFKYIRGRDWANWETTFECH
jgi:hypothetical protein